jgi:hypothetical protein
MDRSAKANSVYIMMYLTLVVWFPELVEDVGDVGWQSCNLSLSSSWLLDVVVRKDESRRNDNNRSTGSSARSSSSCSATTLLLDDNNGSFSDSKCSAARGGMGESKSCYDYYRRLGA